MAEPPRLDRGIERGHGECPTEMFWVGQSQCSGPAGDFQRCAYCLVPEVPSLRFAWIATKYLISS